MLMAASMGYLRRDTSGHRVSHMAALG